MIIIIKSNGNYDCNYNYLCNYNYDCTYFKNIITIIEAEVWASPRPPSFQDRPLPRTALSPGPPSPGPPSPGPLPAGPLSAGPPKISLFFPLSRHNFHSFFPLLGSFRGIMVVFEAAWALTCARLEFSGCRGAHPIWVPNKAVGVSHNLAEDPFHPRPWRLWGFKHHQNYTRRPPREEENMKIVAGEGKKARNFGPPTVRVPTLRDATLRGRTLRGPTLQSPPDNKN